MLSSGAVQQPKPDSDTLFFFFSADEKFDGTYQTNVVVSSEGGCLYVPPGIFKVSTYFPQIYGGVFFTCPWNF